MRSKLLVATCIAASLLFIVGCKKETTTMKNPALDFELLKGGAWIDVHSSSAPTTMKFRFYGDERVTYSFRTAVYPSLKYDSFPNGRWEFVYPDTLRLYDHSWNCYGYLQVLSLSKEELRTKMQGYNDLMIFKKEN